MARAKKYHNDHCSNICLGCLKRIKKNPRSLHNNEKLSKLATDHLYPDFLENRLFLPSAFCQTCNDKVISPNPKGFPLVKYKLLVDNVKASQGKVMSGEIEKCDCEICRISSATINAQKTSFLIEEIKIGRPNIAKQKHITDFFQSEKGSSNKETIQNILNQVSEDSADQFCAEHLGNKVQSPIYFITLHITIGIITLFLLIK